MFSLQISRYSVGIKKTCEAYPSGEKSSFIFTVCVKSVSLYHSKLACVVLHMAVKEFLQMQFEKMEKWAILNGCYL